jgi:hypothetical protein
MKPIPEFQELDITLFADEIISTFLTSKFLKESQIVPQNWGFASPEQGKVVFTNEVSISARDGEIVFTEPIDSRRISKMNIDLLAKNWVNTLNEFNYSAIQIQVRSFFTFQLDRSSDFTQYISTDVLGPNNLESASIKPIRGNVNLLFTSRKGEFIIKVEDVTLKQEDNSLQAGAMFSGDFSYEVEEKSANERQKQIGQFIDGWQEDWKIYQDIVIKRFLKM